MAGQIRADASSAERVQQGGLRVVVTDLMRDPASADTWVTHPVKSATSSSDLRRDQSVLPLEPPVITIFAPG
jgi:hypothetical protein